MGSGAWDWVLEDCPGLVLLASSQWERIKGLGHVHTWWSLELLVSGTSEQAHGIRYFRSQGFFMPLMSLQKSA
jgi:hypothetical protein